VALCSLLALVSIQEVMLKFFIFLYVMSAVTVAWHFWGDCFANKRIVTAKEAVCFIAIVLCPALNTMIAISVWWDALEGVVIWRRNDQA